MQNRVTFGRQITNRDKFKKKYAAYGYVLPAILILVMLLLYPIIRVIGYSFFDNVLVVKESTFVGLKTYVELFQDEKFINSSWNTLVFTLFSVIFHVILGLTFAQLLNRKMNRIALSFFRTIFILPWIFTAAVVAVNWQLILSPLGIVNYILKNIHIISANIEWFGDPKIAMVSLIIVNIWRGYPFMMISLLAGLQSIPSSLNEAANVDGANAFQRFIHITIPQLKPILISVGLLDIIFTLRLFPLIWLTTGGGPVGATETMATYLYKLAFYEYEYSKASALAVIILLFTSVIAVFYGKHQKSIDN
ncbi:sugar ABC transporter permease [Clostridium sediminicola]|uniref:carbohydrate ABC transporter permease n=1 Tax=Clostridium sediminicola TaxID=3114879 RepID=UPI0031F1F74B